MKIALVSSILAVAASAQNYTLASFGTPCGGVLHGQLVTTSAGTGLRLLAVTPTAAQFAILVAGSMAPAPITLPNSQCTLLVQPHVLVPASATSTLGMQWHVHVPATVPFTFDFQAILVGFTGTGLHLGSTDGVELVGQ